jgi:hypothetical protein
MAQQVSYEELRPIPVIPHRHRQELHQRSLPDDIVQEMMLCCRHHRKGHKAWAPSPPNSATSPKYTRVRNTMT